MDSPRVTRKPRCLPSARLLRQRRLGIAFLLTTLAARVGAQAPSDAAEGLQFQRADGQWTTQAALDTDVHFRIEGLLAEVVVEQTYRNGGNAWIEGRYLLPLPETAAVSSLNVQIGERVIVGEVKEKGEAKAIYAAAAANGQAAALVEQNRPNLFQTAVANVGPGETVQVRIGYWQRVDYRDGAFSIDLPLTLTSRYAAGDAEHLPAAPAAGRERHAAAPTVSLRADLTAGVALAGIDSPTHAIDVQRQGDHAVVTLRDDVIAGDRDFELRWTPAPNASPQSALFVETRDDAQYAFAMLLPPTQKVQALPRELMLVIDTSGSMEGLSIRQARDALVEALARLRPGDRFNLVQFNSVTESLFEQAQPADDAHLRVAADWVSNLVATGGTEMSPALDLALAGKAPAGYVRQVVFITDAAVGNENELLAKIERDLGDARLFPVGIGSAPNGWFLRKAAELGRGSDLMIRAPEQVVAQMDRLFGKLDRPALGGIDLQWPAGAEVYPARLPDLYHGEPLLAVAKLPQDGGVLKARGWSVQGEWQDAINLSRAYAMDGVARVWGRSKIDALEDELRQGAAEEMVRPQVVALAIEHHLVSRYTSLVAVEHAPSRPATDDLSSVKFENATPDGQLGYAQGGTDARSKFACGAALALLALALLQRRAVSPV